MIFRCVNKVYARRMSSFLSNQPNVSLDGASAVSISRVVMQNALAKRRKRDRGMVCRETLIFVQRMATQRAACEMVSIIGDAKWF